MADWSLSRPWATPKFGGQRGGHLGDNTQICQRRSPSDFGLRGFFVPENVVPKVRVELTQGHPYRFLSLVRVVLISVIRRDLVQTPEYVHSSVRD